MRPETVAWLANVRAEATAPGAILVIVRGPAGSVTFFPEDIVGKSDDELLAFIADRLLKATKPVSALGLLESRLSVL